MNKNAKEFKIRHSWWTQKQSCLLKYLKKKIIALTSFFLVMVADFSTLKLNLQITLKENFIK